MQSVEYQLTLTLVLFATVLTSKVKQDRMNRATLRSVCHPQHQMGKIFTVAARTVVRVVHLLTAAGCKTKLLYMKHRPTGAHVRLMQW